MMATLRFTIACILVAVAALGAGAALVSQIPVPIPENYLQHDTSLQGANGKLGVNSSVTARLDTANTWSAVQTFSLAPVFSDQSGTRSALGLGTAATANTGTAGATLPFLNGANTWAAAQTFSVAPTFTDQGGTQTALGLGSIATQSASGVAITGGSVSVSTLQVSGNPTPYVLAQSAVGATAPADTNEDALATITIPANAIGANGCVNVQTLWSYTNSANTKTLRVRYSGGSGTTYLSTSVTTTASVNTSLDFCNRSSTSSQVGQASNSVSGGASTSAATTSSVDTTQSTTLVITGQKASSGETLTLERYSVTVRPHS